MEKLLFLGIDTTTADAFKYAKSKGIYTVITDYLEDTSSPLKKKADEWWRINVDDLDTLEQRCREEKITHIYAGSHEMCLDSCRILCERLGIPFYAAEKAWKVARDKERYKTYCQRVGLDVPKEYWIGGYPPEDTFCDLHFPVVVKPVDSNAKRGFSRVNTMDELWHAIEYALDFSKQKKIIVEDFINGNLVTVFCCIHNGKLNLIDTMIYLSDEADGKSFYAYGIHYSRYNEDIEKNLMPAYERLVEEMGCEEGTIFFQSLLCDHKYYQLEAGYRLDGTCTWRHIERQTGFSQLKYMVDLALGDIKQDQLTDINHNTSSEICANIVYWGKPGRINSIVGKKELYNRQDIIFQWDRFQEGDSISNTNDMTTIALIIEVFGKSHAEINEKIKEMNQLLHYYDENGKDLLIYHDQLLEKWKALENSF